jgi:hypothetical protein
MVYYPRLKNNCFFECVFFFKFKIHKKKFDIFSTNLYLISFQLNFKFNLSCIAMCALILLECNKDSPFFEFKKKIGL